jgi:receptor protein-tyrosine kinase
MTMQIASMRVDLRSLRERGYGEDHPSILQIKDRIRASEIELEKKRQEVLKQEFTAQLDDYRTQLKAVDDQETKLLADLKDTNKRKEDLLRIRLQKEKLDEDIARLTVEQTDIKRAVQELETLANQSAFDRVKIARSAQTPTSMSFPKLKLLLPLGVFLMGGLVGGLVVLRELLDQRVRGPADLALIPRLSVLGMIPEAGEDPARPKAVETTFRDNPTGVITESFRQVRSLLAKRMAQVGAKSLVVIGGMPGSGASTVVANLGMALAGLDERVLIIDGNLRRPSLHKSFGVNEGPGLGEVLSGLATFESAIQQTGVPNVSLLAAGAAANRALPERLGGEAMARVLTEAANMYDRIIVDTSPAIVSGDGLALANRCDAVTLVVKALSEKRGMVNRLRSSIGETRAEFMGVIVNAVRSSAGGYFRKNIETAHKYHDGKK